MSYTISTLLTRNLHDVFGENDPARRRAAIDEIFTEDCVFYEPRGVYCGRDEIDRVAGTIKATHPDFHSLRLFCSFIRRRAYPSAHAQALFAFSSKGSVCWHSLARLTARYCGALAVMEAGAHSPWVSRYLEGLGWEVIVSNPRKVRAIYQHERKSDRRDALMLARIGRMGNSSESKLFRGRIGALRSGSNSPLQQSFTLL